MISLKMTGLASTEQDLADAGAYRLTLAGLVLPLGVHCAFNAFAAAIMVLLGHPWIALFGFLGCCAVDTLFQLCIRTWLRGATDNEDARGLRRVGAICAVRASIYLMPGLFAALQGGTAELAYLGIVACAIIALAPAAGSLSRQVFWGFAGPVLMIGVVGVLMRYGMRPATALLMSLANLAVLLSLISIGTTKAVSAWQAAFQANRALIPELEAARDQAVAERRAADAAREEARGANSAKSNFLATMSHEIRTPMNGVLGMAQLLKHDEKNPIQAERIDMLIESGEHLMSILNDILDVSKIDAGKLEIVRGVEDLHLFLDRLVGFWDGRAHEKGVQLNLHMDESLPDFVMMDALRLRQVLFNLLGNALKFTEFGKVEIHASARPKGRGVVWVKVAVCDTGPGVSPESLSTLFERFSQGDGSEVRRFGGAGLGLAIAKQLTELMGGRISVESVLDEGSTFQVEIPMALTAAAAKPAARAAAVGEPIRPLSILAVDDNNTNLVVLDQLLSALGHRVTTADGGRQALEILRAEAFDLLLLDVQMPGMTGIELLHQLRAAKGPNRHAPAIALTADVTSGGRQRYLDLGFTEHGAKPIQIEELIGAIDHALSLAPGLKPGKKAGRRAG